MLIFGGAFLRSEICTHFKITWASRIVGSKFPVFALSYLVFKGNFPSTSPRGAYIWRGDLTEGFSRYRIGGLIFEGAYFRNFTVCFYVNYAKTAQFIRKNIKKITNRTRISTH